MKKILLSFVLSCTCYLAYTQEKYREADSIAALVKQSDLSLIHRELVKDLESDESKLRAFYSWIAHNIHYDVSEWQKQDKNPVKQEPTQVLKSRKAICHGYAALFMEFCTRSGIPCYMASGYNRLDNRFDNSGHTWNMVYINEQWRPVDVTWGAGGIDPRGKYVKEFEDKYFLAEPLEFLQDHYPFDPMWQLVDHPVKLSDYKSASWTYKDNSSPYFNYNDTIAAWIQLDSLEKDYISAHRMQRFSPGDPLIRQQLSYSLFVKGNAEFEKGNKIMAVLYPRNASSSKKPATPVNRKLKAAQLDSIDTFYTHADFYYKQVQFTSESEKTVLKNNREALRFNREVVRKEKSNLTRP
jgi:hypothetical protein